jgi:Flp pilus assembly protein TadG
MRRLRRPRRDDEGAVAVLIAVLLGGGVLLGMGALVIDVGLIAHEREQLRSGADSAAWAVAYACMTTPDTCAADSAALAQRQADGNAKDGSAAAAVAICEASCARTRQSPCPAVPASLTAPFAEARTTTREADGSSLLPPVLAQALSGGYQGTTVGMCSQVAWGTPTAGTVAAIGISHCAWRTTTLDGTVFPGATQVIAAGNAGVLCGASVPPGWLPTTGFQTFATDSSCLRPVTVGSATSLPVFAADCTSALATAMDSGEPVLLPITDAMQATQYRIAGLAGFVVTGYRIGPLSGQRGGGAICPTGDCIRGYFTRLYEPVNATLPGSTRDYGVTYITRIG